MLRSPTTSERGTTGHASDAVKYTLLQLQPYTVHTLWVGVKKQLALTQTTVMHSVMDAISSLPHTQPSTMTGKLKRKGRSS